ncbi:MAG TPA: hypothetical protein VN841_29130 [Bryobacteraceae bacterium]|nr:hypothetical protein [Bryobacteraceae bacterium]
MRWEYKVTGYPEAGDLAELGEEGWELAACDRGRYIFRRPKPEAPPVTNTEAPRREFFEATNKGKKK